MDTNSRKWRWERMVQSLIASALLLLQNSLVISAEATFVHIVYMGDKIYQNPQTTKKYHHQILSSLLGSKEAAKNSILYSYKHGFSGFAARLTKHQAEPIAKFPGVVSVIPNGIHKLHTTRSWDFMGIYHSTSKTAFSNSNLGEGTIIGVIDTGIWPESPSFNDEAMGQIPSRWKGICQVGEHFNSTNCNKKIIGARWFMKGLTDETKKLLQGNNTSEYLSARDAIGHGTHTASTAAGYFVGNANYRGLASGLARGGAPLAHLAIYKGCWDFPIGDCTDADILKAFDKAIHDGVDVLTVSLGFAIPLFSYVDQHDTIAIGSFHAAAKGITVVCSAGNSGAMSQTVTNTAPWIITVGATTIDRAFPAAITLGNNRTVWYLRLRALQRQSYTHYFYEATVGAGLPIVSTLRGLLETGDKILQIEGIFSGTLSYIFNSFKDGRVFSEVVAEAKEAGYTEPDPRDDLSGTDVARKVIILARESGLKLELSNIPVESLVPEPLRACASAQEFMQELPKFDQEFTKKQQDAENAGEVLRYVGVVDVINKKGVVELRRYKKDHPFAQLSGSDNIIAFTTRRYQHQPLIVRGPGAGAQVTAGGIFSDILRLASYLGAPS